MENIVKRKNNNEVMEESCLFSRIHHFLNTEWHVQASNNSVKVKFVALLLLRVSEAQ